MYRQILSRQTKTPSILRFRIRQGRGYINSNGKMACKNRIKDGIDSTFDVPGLQDSKIIELFVIRFISCCIIACFSVIFDWNLTGGKCYLLYTQLNLVKNLSSTYNHHHLIIVFLKKHWFTFLFKEAGCKRHDGIIVGGSILLPKQPRDRTWTSQTAFLKYITHFETLSSKSLQFKKAIRELQHKFLERKENYFLFGTTSYYYRTIYQPLLL